MVSGFYFTPLPGFFSPFPHGTCSLSVTREYLALRDGPRGFRQGFTCPAVLRILQRDESISYTGLSPTMATLSNAFYYTIIFLLSYRSPTTPVKLVWAVPLSLATTKGIDFSFSSSGYLDVSVHRVPFHTLWIGVWIPGVCPGGFPHSEISGSMDICSSPKLIAAYHVFHRLLVPRHPPCALFCLASSDAIALTSDGLLVFFLSLLSQCLVFVSILRFTYHQEMNVLHMRFSRYSAQQNQNARQVLALRSVFLFCCIGCLLATEAASLPMCGLAHC